MPVAPPRSVDGAGGRRHAARIRESHPRRRSPPPARTRSVPKVSGSAHRPPGRSFPAPPCPVWWPALTPSYRSAESCADGPAPDCRMRLRRPWGGSRRDGDTFRHNTTGRKVMHGFVQTVSWYSATGLPVQFESGGNAFIAGDLPDVGDRGGHVQRAIKLLIGAEGVVRHRIVADGGEAGAQGGPGRQDIELDRPLVAKDLLRGGPAGRRQRHERQIAGAGRRLAEHFRDRVGALHGHCETAPEWDRMLDRRANLALLV